MTDPANHIVQRLAVHAQLAVLGLLMIVAAAVAERRLARLVAPPPAGGKRPAPA